MIVLEVGYKHILYFLLYVTLCAQAAGIGTMAGPVRQPIDLKALEKYVNEHVPEIKTPLDLKQVRPPD